MVSEVCNSTRSLLNSIFKDQFEQIELLAVTQIKSRLANFQMAVIHQGPIQTIISQLVTSFRICENDNECKESAERFIVLASFTEDSVEIAEQFDDNTYFIWRIDSRVIAFSFFWITLLVYYLLLDF